MPRGQKTPPFDKHYLPEPTSGCWLWEDCVDKDGYGRLDYHGRRYRAHRLSYILHRGAIPAGMYVLHKCDTPGCVNPDHLFIGNAGANASDNVRKGRHPCGKNHYRAKLTEADVMAIRLDTRPHAVIAKAYEIMPSSIRAIKRRLHWKHIP